MTSAVLLATCAAVGVFIDLMFRLVGHLDVLHIFVRTRIVSAQTPDDAEGIRVFIHNRGHYPANIDWLRIESQATSLRLPLHDRSPMSRAQTTPVPWRYKTCFAPASVVVMQSVLRCPGSWA
jgi:hypothetical protein